MKPWVVAAVMVVAAGPLLMLAAGLALRALVAGSGKDQLAAALERAAGVKVSVGSGHFDLGQWFRLSPALSLEDVKIGNPPGFGPGSVLEARRLSAQVALIPLLRKRIQVLSIGVEGPRVTILRDARGTSNLVAFLKKLTAGRGGDAGPEVALAIASLSVGGGETQGAGLNLRDIELRVRNFQPDRSCQLELAARLFGGEHSRLGVEARLGPFGGESLPMMGTARVTLAPAEVPLEWRADRLGNLLRAPGPKARAQLEAKLQGDIYGVLEGPARLVLTDVLVGKDEKHLLPLGGEVQLTLSASNLMAAPRYEIRIPDAALQLGRGQWKGEARTEARGLVASGSSRGSLRLPEIDELVSSLTAAGGKIHGAVEIPSYSMQFAGSNADQMRDSLRASGTISVTQGRVAFLDLMASIERALEPGRQEAGESGVTPFSTLTAAWRVQNGQLLAEDIVLQGPGLRATGHGVIGFDHSIHFELDAYLTGNVAKLLNRVTLRPGREEARVPLVIRGTLEQPRVRPQIGSMAKKAAKGMLDSVLKRR